MLQRLLLVVSYLPIPIHIIAHASYSHLSPVPVIPQRQGSLYYNIIYTVTRFKTHQLWHSAIGSPRITPIPAA
jgi:hypothetical protein